MKISRFLTLAGICLSRDLLVRASIDLKGCFDADEYKRNLIDIEQKSSSNLNYQPDQDGAEHGRNGIIDCHVHVIPSWYRDLVPLTGGNPTPSWSLNDHFQFNKDHNITHSIVSFSSPGPNIPNSSIKCNQTRSVVIPRLARAQNVYMSHLKRFHVHQFDFYAAVPLPFVQEAIEESKYALDELGAVGLQLYSNVEGTYLGDPHFQPFFEYLNTRVEPVTVAIHPNNPSANPTRYAPGRVEFYFETARVIEDLALSQTISNFTNIHYFIPHAGGSWPSVADRLLGSPFNSSYPDLRNVNEIIASSRFAWDTAGPTFPHQVLGLLGYGISKEQLVYGSDWPYAQYPVDAALNAVKSSSILDAKELRGVLEENAARFFRLDKGVRERS